MGPPFHKDLLQAGWEKQWEFRRKRLRKESIFSNSSSRGIFCGKERETVEALGKIDVEIFVEK